MPFLEIWIAVLLGLLLGSFATALVYRVPRGLPWAYAGKRHVPADITAYRSVCTNCKTKLKPIDLIPLFSWLMTWGKCRYCGSPIGWTYPLTELLVVLGCLGIYWGQGFSAEGAFLMLIMPFLVALIMIDLEHMILPDELVMIVGGFGILNIVSEIVLGNMPAGDLFVENIVGGGVFGLVAWGMGLIMTKLLKKDSLGFGDVKFFFVAGIWLGLSNLAWFCILSGLLGVVFAIFWQVIKKERVFPFGPALIIALYVLLSFEGSLLL